jgi:hypothetical protein
MANAQRSTTIQISGANMARLTETGEIMRRIFPDLFTTVKPTRDQQIGFLAGQFLSGITDDEIEYLAGEWERASGRPAR